MDHLTISILRRYSVEKVLEGSESPTSVGVCAKRSMNGSLCSVVLSSRRGEVVRHVTWYGSPTNDLHRISQYEQTKRTLGSSMLEVFSIL